MQAFCALVTVRVWVEGHQADGLLFLLVIRGEVGRGGAWGWESRCEQECARTEKSLTKSEVSAY